MEKKLISKKKPFYPISKELTEFLKKHDRWVNLDLSYEDLLRFSDSITVYDKNDNDTLWVRTFYSESDRKEIDHNLKIIYTILHSDGNQSSIPYLNIDSIDYKSSIDQKSLDEFSKIMKVLFDKNKNSIIYV